MISTLNDSNFEEEMPGELDCYITFSSFEDRCLSLTSRLVNRCVIKHSYIFGLDEFVSETSENLDKLKNILGGGSKEVCFSHCDPTNIADKIYDILDSESRESKIKVAVDISTFNRESLLILIRVLEMLARRFDFIKFFYTAANTSRSLSSGIVEIRSVIGYLGNMLPYKPLHLVIMSGFEHDRANAIIESYEPDFISIGYGAKDASISTDLHEMNLEFTDKVASWYEPGVVQTFEYSLIDPEKTKESIDKAVSSRDECNVVLVPLNNKISTVGAGLYAIEHEDVQVCYSQMGKYNTESYSEAKDEFYIIDMFQSLTNAK